MQRRSFIVAAAVALTAGCTEGAQTQTGRRPTSESVSTEPETVDPDEIPEDLQPLQSLAVDLDEQLEGTYHDVRVWFNKDGELAVQFHSHASSEDGVMSDFHGIADEYVTILEDGDYDPVTLTIVTGEVQAIVSKPALTARLDDRLEQDAFHETIGVTDVQRRE